MTADDYAKLGFSDKQAKNLMKNADYWKNRFSQLEEAQNKKGTEAFKEIEAQYKQAQKEIEGKINTWYQRLAVNNGITAAEARKRLSKSDLKEFKWDVEDYIRYGKENAIDGKWMKQLENASAKVHITKLEELKIQTQQSLEEMYAKQMSTVSSAMTDTYKSGYYHTAYEIQKGLNIGWDIAGLNQSEIEKVISKPWAVDGKNFSERIWGNKDKLISKVHSELTRNIKLGADPQKAINNIAKKMNTSKTNAGRLVMTEEAYFSSIAQKECFEELEVEEYEIVATLDSHTSEICRSLDGKHFPMKNYEPGVTAPPFHVNCRSTTVPYFDDDLGETGERAARDKDGKTYYVPANMTYKDWEKTFVDGGDKSGLQEIKKSVAKTDESGIIDLSKDELQAIKSYISSASYTLNEKLRDGLDLDEDDIKLITNLDNALEKMPDYEGNLQRSVYFDTDEEIEEFLKEFVVEDVCTFEQYISTTKGDTYNPDAQIQIFIKDSKKGKDISKYNTNEQEVLFKRNSEFMTVDIRKIKGVYYIWLKEV